MSDLKPCPFCGSAPEATRRAPSLPLFFECPNKCASAWGSDQWNRRTPSPAVKALVEAAKQHHQCATIRNDGTCAGCNLSEALAAVEREIGVA